MSRLNFNRNVFLEKEELVNFQNFLSPSMIKEILMNATYSFGLVTNNNNKINENDPVIPEPSLGFNNPFVVEQGSTLGTAKILPGTAINQRGEFIKINVEDNIPIPSDSLWYWMKIGYKVRNYESGLVSINVKGAVSGNVDFTGKVRGQSTATPVCIRFEKEDGSVPLNNKVYQIVNVVDKNNLILTSASTFVAESNLRVIVLGTLPLGGVFTEGQKQGLYSYDHYDVSLVREISVETPPDKEDGEYYIARIQNSGGSILIDTSIDKEYWSLGNFKK